MGRELAVTVGLSFGDFDMCKYVRCVVCACQRILHGQLSWLNVTTLRQTWEEEAVVTLPAVYQFRWLFVSVNYLAFCLSTSTKYRGNSFKQKPSVFFHNSVKDQRHLPLQRWYNTFQFPIWMQIFNLSTKQNHSISRKKRAFFKWLFDLCQAHSCTSPSRHILSCSSFLASHCTAHGVYMVCCKWAS